jgi:hypothetical protein
MMINFSEISSGEVWELFARDFLTELGFYIESSPDRGADAGKDLLVTEELTGTLGKYQFRWLVSCKHFAQSGKSVTEDDEKNLLERLAAFGADGFIGIYSTIPSAGFNSRLQSLRFSGKLKDYRFFEHRLIENHLIRIGYSDRLMRYFPESYREVRPIHLVTSEYLPLNCKRCGKELLEALFREEYTGLVLLARRISAEDPSTDVRYIEEVSWACKGPCDRAMEDSYYARGLVTGWEDISDLVIPPFFMRWVLTLMNTIRAGDRVFSDVAYNQMKYFVLAVSQKVLRETTATEQSRFLELLELP